MIEDESKKKKIKMFRVIIASVLGMLEPAKGPAMGKFPWTAEYNLPPPSLNQ